MVYLFYTLSFAALTNMETHRLAPCLDAPQKLEFFHSLSITSIFGRMHATLNVGKK
jgi:hypothetical protein